MRSPQSFSVNAALSVRTDCRLQSPAGTGFTWNRNLPPTRPLMTGDSSSDRHFRPVRTQQLRLLQHGLHGFFLQIQRGSLRLQD